jgi:hypothetical protein
VFLVNDLRNCLARLVVFPLVAKLNTHGGRAISSTTRGKTIVEAVFGLGVEGQQVQLSSIHSWRTERNEMLLELRFWPVLAGRYTGA